MKISLPVEPVVYYESSYGNFRLTYHTPPDQLQLLIARNELSPKVLDDYPDGVDLNCTESDFANFQERYGYRPPIAPDSIHRAFFALLSSTRDWKNFRGSGIVPAKDIKRYAESVEAYLSQNQAMLGEFPEIPDHPRLEQRHQYRDQQARRESMITNLLENMALEGIDPGRTLKNQAFSPIEMQAGEDAAEFFSELLRTRGRR